MVSGFHAFFTKTKHCPCIEGKYQSISKADSAYLQHIATRDALRLAKSKYPAITENFAALVIDVDNLVCPLKVQESNHT